MKESLFSHLVFRFSSSPENLATESLNFILNRSPITRSAFSDLFNHFSIEIPDTTKFDTQDKNQLDGAIPDLVGRNSVGEVVLYGEAKFWAGLTENQPVTYIKRLQNLNGKLLLIFAPAKRFTTLWPELLHRCDESQINFSEVISDIPEVKIVHLTGNQHLVLVSWRVILTTIHQALEVEGERNTLSDLTQLEGLCAQMDKSAFLPLQSEELTSNLSIRLVQYSEMVDEVAHRLIAENYASKSGLRAAANRFGYLQYLKVGESLNLHRGKRRSLE